MIVESEPWHENRYKEIGTKKRYKGANKLSFAKTIFFFKDNFLKKRFFSRAPHLFFFMNVTVVE